MASEQFYTIKGVIASLPGSDQREIEIAYRDIKLILDSGDNAILAFALIGIEQQDNASPESLTIG